MIVNLSSAERSYQAKDFTANLLDWDSYDEAMQAAVTPYLYQLIIETGQEALQQIGQQPSQFDPFASAIREYQQSRSRKIAMDVNDETEKQLRATLTEAINAGESTYQMRARIEKIFGFASTQRADLIASTEVARAQSFADIHAWRESGLVVEKEWYTAKDERVCPWCKDMHGTRIPLDDNFFDKGDVQVVEVTNRNGETKQRKLNHDYDDVPGCPLHPRCRCTLLPVRDA